MDTTYVERRQEEHRFSAPFLGSLNSEPRSASRADDELISHPGRKATNAYLKRVGAEWRNFRKAVRQEGDGRYKRVTAEFKFGADGAVQCPDEAKPTKEEAEAIKAEFLAHGFPIYEPQLKTGRTCDDRDIRKMLAPFGLGQDRPGEVSTFSVFWNETHNLILMIEQRIDKGPGDKALIPWTPWSDHKWRRMEPDGLPPLFGLDLLSKQSSIIIHEGTKKARYIRELVEDKKRREAHPWGKELASGVHLAWPGGAPNGHRVDWEPIKRRRDLNITIVADNDRPGKEAVRDISRELKRGMKAIMFDGTFPPAFDLAEEEWPKGHYREVNGVPVYVGPSFQDCIESVTWATIKIPTARGAPSYRLVPAFVDEWTWSVKPHVLVHRDNPSQLYSEDEFNRSVRPLSDVEDTAKLLRKQISAKLDSITYNPGLPSGAIIERSSGERQINVYAPGRIRPVFSGSPRERVDRGKPFLDYMSYLIPDEADRHYTLRWCATLIAHPGVKMQYGLLLCSKMTGVGKTTLGDHILRPLLGSHNVSVPREQDVVDSAFNAWIARKRLVIISEIYAGHSWKAYNTLKQAITDRSIDVNEKHKAPYTLESWAHFIASSNSVRPLKFPDDERRWLKPRVVEVRRPKEYWEGFYQWLAHDGLGMILHWAHDYVEEHGAVGPGDIAPMTESKRELIEESRDEDEALALGLGEHAMELSAKGEKIILIDRYAQAGIAAYLGINKERDKAAWNRSFGSVRDGFERAGMNLLREWKVRGVRYAAYANFEVEKGWEPQNVSDAVWDEWNNGVKGSTNSFYQIL